jgi:hypothetical protein
MVYRHLTKTKKTKLHDLSPRANYTYRATAACQRSDCQLLRIEGATYTDQTSQYKSSIIIT